jgi:hypothetical protein
VAAQDVLLRRRLARGEREALVQDGEALLRFRVTAGGVELRERRVAYELDRRIASASSSRPRPPWSRPTR